jgi:hypothetical protein
MRHIILVSSLAALLFVSGCGDRSAPPLQEKLAVKSSSLDSDTNTIQTEENYTTVTFYGAMGSKVFINGDEVGVFPESGTLEVTFNIENAGDYTYNIYAVSKEGLESQRIEIEIIKKEQSASLGSVSTAGEANALTVSQEGIIFVAEKNHGVEIISIGYDDKVSSDLLATIDTVDAFNVILSEDESKLYVEDKAGKFHVLDISDLSHPVEVDVIDEIDKSISVESEDGTMAYRISDCGLIGEDISNPSDIQRDFLFADKEIQDVVLVDNDTKLLVAHGEEGLLLLDLGDAALPRVVGRKNLGGDTSGLSLLKKDGVLFVANGSRGVEIFALDILLHEMVQ